MSVNRVVVVSGGSRGLGAAIVDTFLRQGYKVACFSRSGSEQVEEWRRKYPDSFYFEALSLADGTACKAFLGAVESRWSEVGVLVNNAAVTDTSLLALASDEAIDELVDLNIKGSLRLTRLVSRSMLTSGWGRIINISSIVGISGYRGLAVYSATKAALDGVTRALARELGPRGVTVNSVAPGYIETAMTEELSAEQMQQIVRRTPVGRLGEPADVAAMVAYLAGDDASFITGQVLVVDGGISC